jgi:hypothetical protein
LFLWDTLCAKFVKSKGGGKVRLKMKKENYFEKHIELQGLGNVELKTKN